MNNNTLDTEREAEDFQKSLRRWKRWSKKQPQDGGLPYDEWLRLAPASDKIIPPHPAPKPSPQKPAPPDVTEGF